MSKTLYYDDYELLQVVVVMRVQRALVEMVRMIGALVGEVITTTSTTPTTTSTTTATFITTTTTTTTTDHHISHYIGTLKYALFQLYKQLIDDYC